MEEIMFQWDKCLLEEQIISCIPDVNPSRPSQQAGYSHRKRQRKAAFEYMSFSFKRQNPTFFNQKLSFGSDFQKVTYCLYKINILN